MTVSKDKIYITKVDNTYYKLHRDITINESYQQYHAKRMHDLLPRRSGVDSGNRDRGILNLGTNQS